MTSVEIKNSYQSGLLVRDYPKEATFFESILQIGIKQFQIGINQFQNENKHKAH